MNVRYLTRAAEILGDRELTVDLTIRPNDQHHAECRGCGDRHSVYLYTAVAREWAQAHAETCRAMPATDAV
ncbi:hypothetical protein [Streptomyces zhihengii]